MATDLAQHYGAELHLVHVVLMIPTETGIDGFTESPLPFEMEFLQESKDRAEQALATYIGALVSKGVKASCNVEIGNDVADSILMVADSEHIDMVVLSTHGISGWRPLVLGSTAEKVVRLVQCPLLLLRSIEPVATATVSAPDLEKS
jgi:nucleotide-binding universal stress UspA family protein